MRNGGDWTLTDTWGHATWGSPNPPTAPGPIVLNHYYAPPQQRQPEPAPAYAPSSQAGSGGGEVLLLFFGVALVIGLFIGLLALGTLVAERLTDLGEKRTVRRAYQPVFMRGRWWVHSSDGWMVHDGQRWVQYAESYATRTETAAAPLVVRAITDGADRRPTVTSCPG